MFFACTGDFSWIRTQIAAACFGGFFFGATGGFTHRQMFYFLYSRRICSLSLFFIVSEMDAVKVRGRGCTSIYPAIHFIPLRGLDYSGETKVIRIHVIPKIQQKKKKKISPNAPSHPFHHDAYSRKSAVKLPTLHADELFNACVKPVIPASW